MRPDLNAQWLRDTFLFGVDLTDDAGNPYPDGLFDLCIEAATEILEAELGVTFRETTRVDELHDIVSGDWHRAYQFQTHLAPLRSVNAITFQQGDFMPLHIPDSWIYIRNAALGLVELIPGRGLIARSSEFFGATAPGQAFNFLGWHVEARRAGYLRVSYAAGFDDDAPLPAAIKMAIGHIAAMLPLDTAGDLIAGAGIANYSTSMDGLSESVGTTSSATNSGYGARILSYQGQLKTELASLRKRYLGPMFTAL